MPGKYVYRPPFPTNLKGHLEPGLPSAITQNLEDGCNQTRMNVIKDAFEFRAAVEGRGIEPGPECLKRLSDISQTKRVELTCLEPINLPPSDPSLLRNILLTKPQPNANGCVDARELSVCHGWIVTRCSSPVVICRLSFAA